MNIITSLQNPAASLILKFVLGNIFCGLPLGRSWFLWVNGKEIGDAFYLVIFMLCFRRLVSS